MLKRVDVAVYDAFTTGPEVETGVHVFGLAEDGVGFALDEFNSDLITEEMIAAVDTAREAINRGRDRGPQLLGRRHLPRAGCSDPLEPDPGAGRGCARRRGPFRIEPAPGPYGMTTDAPANRADKAFPRPSVPSRRNKNNSIRSPAAPYHAKTWAQKRRGQVDADVDPLTASTKADRGESGSTANCTLIPDSQAAIRAGYRDGPPSISSW